MSIDFKKLDASISGDVVTPQDEQWDVARLAWNLAVDQQPRAVVYCESSADVATAVEFAASNSLRVASQSTGHSAGSLGSLSDTLLLKFDRMRGVRIDAAAATATVAAGTQWGEVVEAAAQHGLAPLSGSAPDVGVLGYTLGGGLSWMGRKFGLACNSVTAATVIGADGSEHRAAADSEQDLFWAIRGAGGNFGPVTELEFKLFPVPSLYAGVLFWPMERAGEVLHRWREWADSVPNEVTSLGRLLRVPPFPEIPEPVRGKSFVMVEAACVGDESMSELFVPLRELEPAMDTFAMIPPPGLAALHMDPPEPVPGTGHGFNLRDLDAQAIDRLIELAGADSQSPLLSFELRHLGGELGRANPEGGALSHLDARFACFGVGMTPDAQSKSSVLAALGEVEDAMAGALADQGYLNFTEQPRPAESFYPAEIHERLCQLKGQRDPDNLFHSYPAIQPA